jgi:EAL domain-containing protein (putative c-di-GMP-specific phosphodiesterase class I)
MATPFTATSELGSQAHPAARGGRITGQASPGELAEASDANWLARLRHAIAEDMFVLHFQPIVSLRDGRVCQHEALLRLADDPGGGVIAPGDLLPVAERHGLISEIDELVVEKVAALLGAGAPTPIAVNVSATTLSRPALLAHIARSLARHGADPAELIVEVTETAAIADMDGARAFCSGVRALHCAIALDDFGAGFGSFRYLKHLPYDYLKIDGEFIRGLPASRTDQLVVQALVSVARGMGRRTVAEFVGDATTIEMLRAYGVDLAQGFHVGRPQAALAPA